MELVGLPDLGKVIVDRAIQLPRGSQLRKLQARQERIEVPLMLCGGEEGAKVSGAVDRAPEERSALWLSDLRDVTATERHAHLCLGRSCDVR